MNGAGSTFLSSIGNRLLANPTRMRDLLSVEIGQVEIGLKDDRNRTARKEK
jgi:hypothetical protein